MITEKRNRTLDNLVSHLCLTSYRIEGNKLFFKPNESSLLLNTLFPNIKAEIMIDKSKHRKHYNRDKIISRTVNMFYPNVTGLSVDMEKNIIHIYASKGTTKSLKYLADIVIEQYKMETPKVNYYSQQQKERYK